MASFPLSFPTFPVATERLDLDRRQTAMESPHNYKLTVIQKSSRWTLAWTWPRMSVARAEIVFAWGLSLKGQVGSFKYYPNRTIVSGLTGRSLAAIGYAYNSAVVIGGFAVSELSTIRLGQWITIGNQLLRVTEASAIANTAGQVTVSFEPELRLNYSAGTPVEFVNPFGVFRLATPNSPAYTLDPDRAPDLGTVQAIEVL